MMHLIVTIKACSTHACSLHVQSLVNSAAGLTMAMCWRDRDRVDSSRGKPRQLQCMQTNIRAGRHLIVNEGYWCPCNILAKRCKAEEDRR
jgi:hypothetical protein